MADGAPNGTGDTPDKRLLDREIFALAIPAFATLVAEPLLLMADAAIIGHLGTTQLAGLGVATNLITLIAGLSVFLAYGTTATVARKLGAGDRAGALSGGLDGLFLAAILGVLLCAVLQLLLDPIIGLYGVDPPVAAAAHTYLRISLLGLPLLLIMLASTGVLRGLQDTRTPLYVAIGVNLCNVALSLFLVYVVGLGMAGAAIGTVISQAAAASFLCGVVVRGARRTGARVHFRPAGILRSAKQGGWLFLRNLSLNIGITTTTLVAAGGGAVVLASHQIVNSLWAFLALGLDSIAIAAQAVIGRYLGAGNAHVVRFLTRRMVGWGIVGGIVMGLLIAATRPLYIQIFTTDLDVRTLVAVVLLVVAVIAPVAGVVFVLDGVLIGAGDGRYLALAGLVSVACYLPLAVVVGTNDLGLVWLWMAYGCYTLARMVTLALRARGTRWMRLGA